MLAAGHPHAAFYPLWQLQLEALLTAQRQNQQAGQQAALVFRAVTAAFDGKSLKHFTSDLDRLSDGG